MAYDIKVFPSELKGTVQMPPSKSKTHRALFGAALCNSKSTIQPWMESEDILATLRVITAMGAKARRKKNRLTIKGRKNDKLQQNHIDVKGSATTLRFAIPLLMQGHDVTLSMDETLAGRPMGPYQDIFQDALKIDGSQIKIQGKLEPGEWTIDGSVSSQFVSGMLFALPLLESSSSLTVKGAASRQYINLTLDMLKAFGITILKTGQTYRIPGKQSYRPSDLSIEGDYSQASFFFVAGTANPYINIEPLSSGSQQADEKIVDILQSASVKFIHTEQGYHINKTKTRGITVDIGETPDIAPPLALLGALSEGKTVLKNISRLKYKESDRAEAIVRVLSTLGADIKHTRDRIVIRGGGLKGNATVDPRMDHRISMMATIAGTLSERPVRIKNAHCVEKSFPHFFKTLHDIGAQITYEKKVTAHED